MTTRVVKFTDTGEWYAGAKTKDFFKQDLQAWAAQIGEAHGRPVQGIEIDDPANDPRTGTLVEDAPPEPVALDENHEALVAALAPDATRAVKDRALKILLERVVGPALK